MWVSPETAHQIYLAEQAERDVLLERQRIVAELRGARPRRDWLGPLRGWRRHARRTRVAPARTVCCSPA